MRPLTRWSRREERWSNSEVAPGVWVRMSEMPPARDTSSWRWWVKEAKIGFVSSGTIMPIVGVSGVRSGVGRSYPSSSIAVRTLRRVSAETCPTPLKTRETVAVETPACAAISAMLVRFFVIDSALLWVCAHDVMSINVTAGSQFGKLLQKQNQTYYSGR